MAKKPSVCIGIDIGSYSIKIAEVQRKGKDYVLSRAIVFNCEGDWKDGLPEEVDVAGITLTKAIAAFGGCKEAVLSLPTSVAMMRSVPMESKLKPDELWKTIEANVSQYFPFSSEEVFIDFVPIKTSNAIENHTDILIVAAQKEFISNREICADIAGVKMSAIDINIYGVLNLLHLSGVMNEMSDYDAVMVLDIGLFQSSLSVVTGDQSVYVRDVPIGGEGLTRLIAEQKGISLADAEKIKLSNTENFKDIIDQFTSEVLVQFQSAVDVYVSNNPQITLQAMYIVGGAACSEELERALKENFQDFTINTLSPENIFDVDPAVYSKLNETSIHSLTTAAGLAVRGYL